MLERPSSTFVLHQLLIRLALPEAKWFPTKWSIKSHSSLLGECFLALLLSWKVRESMSFLV
jgi:hypothetical protein